MFIVICLCLGVPGLTVLVLVVRARRKRKAAKQARLAAQIRSDIAALRAAIDGVGRGDYDAAYELRELLKKKRSSFSDELKEMAALALDEYDRQRHRELYRKLREDARDPATAIKLRLKNYAQLLAEMRRGHSDSLLEPLIIADGYDEARMQAELQALVQSYYDELAALAPSSARARAALRQLIVATTADGDYRSPYGEYLHKAEVPELSYPKEWNSWIARAYRDPALWHFVGQPNPMTGNMLGLRAAAALAARDMTEAKIVLAYCDDDSMLRIAVGTHVEQLRELVHAMEPATKLETT